MLHDVQELALRPRRIVRRGETAERPELADEVALVREALRVRQLRPRKVSAAVDRSQRPVQSSHPSEALRAGADSSGEAATEGRGGDAQPVGRIAHPMAERQLRDRMRHRRVDGGVTEATKERVFDHLQHVGVGGRVQRLVAESAAGLPPELREIELDVAQLVRGHAAEKGPGPARPEGHPGDVPLLAGVDRAGTAAEPDHARSADVGLVSPAPSSVGAQGVLVEIHQQLERRARKDPFQRVVVLSPVHPEGDHEGRQGTAPRSSHDRHTRSIARWWADPCDARCMQLTHDELLALAASARVLMEADGEISEGETELARNMGAELGVDDLRWEKLWDEAIRTIPDREALTRVAAVTRTVARELIYEQLYILATDGTIVDPEWDILEWLDEVWRANDEAEPQE